ncbi:hypothetical protein DICVIV_05937 [Dictyocaulus viviparus]|uniref:Uncharacterized protein n=1 Tax=Dictyocaulus viviparus TaxID=29172 RepID=A0A0D8Y036_DICVI|nr:hypothetical protein DICVIV_05937 [Dictyocaulus viviparus]
MDKIGSVGGTDTIRVTVSILCLHMHQAYQAEHCADGHAVQELLPAVKLLYDAGKRFPIDDSNVHWNTIKNLLNAKTQEIRIARQLSSQLPQTGAALHELLGKELYCKKDIFDVGCEHVRENARIFANFLS